MSAENKIGKKIANVLISAGIGAGVGQAFSDELGQGYSTLHDVPDTGNPVVDELNEFRERQAAETVTGLAGFIFGGVVAGTTAIRIVFHDERRVS